MGSNRQEEGGAVRKYTGKITHSKIKGYVLHFILGSNIYFLRRDF